MKTIISVEYDDDQTIVRCELEDTKDYRIASTALAAVLYSDDILCNLTETALNILLTDEEVQENLKKSTIHITNKDFS